MRNSKLLISLLLAVSCISPYDQEASFQEILVVQGMITDQPGPYMVSIIKAKPLELSKQVDTTNQVSGAIVLIQDNLGNVETLKEKSSGNYFTTTTQGIIGRAYSIKVTTEEGEVYESKPDTLLPVGDFSLRYEFQQKEPPQTNNQISSKNGFDVYLDGEVLPEQQKRVWWRWTGTFEYTTFPQLRTMLCCSGSYDSKDPYECSGYMPIDTFYCSPYAWPCMKKLKKIAPCTCCTCWANQYNQSPLISNPRFINNGKVEDLHLGFIETNVRTFGSKYHINVEQLSISSTMYNFWKSILIQESNSSNLFQTPPPRTGGNIKPVSSNSTPVIGYFAASSIVSHTIILYPSDVPYVIYPMDTVIGNCRELYKYTSTTRPSFW